MLIVIRLAYGAVLLLAPEAALSKLARVPVDRRIRLFARVLGARELLQAALARRYRSRDAQLAGAGVDAIHAVSMLALSRADPPRRRPARRNAATATAWALAGLVGACPDRRAEMVVQRSSALGPTRAG